VAHGIDHLVTERLEQRRCRRRRLVDADAEHVAEPEPGLCGSRGEQFLSHRRDRLRDEIDTLAVEPDQLTAAPFENDL
jgi:hypothetical protein